MESLEIVFCVIFLIIVLIVSIVFLCYKLSSASVQGRRIFLLFIDAPDPDNPAAAAAIYKHLLPLDTRNVAHLHIVLTGRPVDLSTSKSNSKPASKSDIVRQNWERSVSLHAEKVLQDSAARLYGYLKSCHIDTNKITIYDGGVAPVAPLSDTVHDWDFLFDRKDLITGQGEDMGGVLSPNEYYTLVEKYSSLTPDDREHELLSLLRTYTLTPLSVLKKEIQSNTCEEIVVFLGGPATAVISLFKDPSMDFAHKVTCLYGMFGCLRPGESTLLNNQFNVACDIEGACDLFVNNLFPDADKYLVTTETAKNSVLMLSSDELEEIKVPSYFCRLHRLWEATHNGRVQPLFDVIPVMAYLSQFKDCFIWNRKKAVLYEWQVKGGQSGSNRVEQLFTYIDSSEPKHPMVSDETVQTLHKTDFMEFMIKTWS